MKESDDIWLIPKNNETVTNFTFDFRNINSSIFKNEIKKIIKEILQNELVKSSSAHRYYSAIKNAFIPFLVENNITLNYFLDITDEIAQGYIFYLKSRISYSADSNSLAMAGIKAIINFGIDLRLPGYPKFNPFPTKTSKIFGTDDVLKTKYISEEDLKKFESALEKEKNIYLKAAIIIAKETGLRLSEVLTARFDCIMNDFEGFPLFYTYSFKNEKERLVPASEEVLNIVEQLKEKYIDNPGRYLFYRIDYFGKSGLISQYVMRYFLKRFCSDNNISHKTFHAFRHTLGTTMLSNGATGYQVQNQLGHESLHSTSLYAKMKNETIDREYYRMPVLGISQEILSNDKEPEHNAIPIPLPDGSCKNVIKDSLICEDSYKCLFCSMYRTFKCDLPTHKLHLERIRKERELYMIEEGINSFELLNDVVRALEEIIERLEAK